MDWFVAGLIGILAAPVIAVLGLWVRRHDGGPAFVRLPRVGRGGRSFHQWKLRSMRADDHRGTAKGPAITAADDDRITPLGRRLRHYRLDELPQLLNVVAGDMALLGPRPETPTYVDLHDPMWRRVLAVRPGVAGPAQVLLADWEAQVVARSTDPDAYRTVVLPVKLAIDSWYVARATPWIDVLIIAALVRRYVGSVDRSSLSARVVANVPSAARLLPPPVPSGRARMGRASAATRRRTPRVARA